MDKEQIVAAFKDIMQFGSPIGFKCDEKYDITVSNEIGIDGQLKVFVLKENSSLLNSIVSWNSFLFDIEKFIDAICVDNAFITLPVHNIKTMPEELINKINAFNAMVMDYHNDKSDDDKCLNENTLPIFNRINSWLDDTNCHGIMVYSPSLELISTITKDCHNSDNVHTQMHVDDNCEHYATFSNGSINTQYRNVDIKLVAEDVYQKELILNPIFHCGDNDNTIVNNYSRLILRSLYYRNVYVYNSGETDHIFVMSYSIKADNDITFVNIFVNKEYNNSDYSKKVVKLLEKYGLDGTIISLFNLLQLIIERNWIMR